MSRSNENMMYGWCNMIPIEIVNCLDKKSTLECGTRCCRTLHAGTILKRPPALPLIPSHRSLQTPSTHDRCASICNLFSLCLDCISLPIFIDSNKVERSFLSRNFGRYKCSPNFETSPSIFVPLFLISYHWLALEYVLSEVLYISSVLNPA